MVPILFCYDFSITAWQDVIHGVLIDSQLPFNGAIATIVCDTIHTHTPVHAQ